MNGSTSAGNSLDKKSPTGKGAGTRSISRRLAIGLTTSVALVSAITFMALYLGAIHKQEADLMRNADESRDYLVGALELPMWNFDKPTVETICRTLSQNKLVEGLMVKDASGSAVHSIGKGRDPEGLSRAGRIFHQGKLLGEVEIFFTKRYVKEDGQRLLFSYATTMLFVLISLALLTHQFLRKFLKEPIDALDTIVRPYAAGVYDAPMAELPYLEFQPFGRTLADMAGKIEEQIRMLRKGEEYILNLNTGLEAQVRQRTLELAESEARFRTIYETSPVSIWREDWTQVIQSIKGLHDQGINDFPAYFSEHPDFVARALNEVKIVDVNQWTLGMFAAGSKADMLASLGTVFSTADTLPGFVGELNALARGETVYRTEMALNTVMGEMIHGLLAMAFPPPGSDSGEVLVSVVDITGRKNFEQALQKSEERMRLFFERQLVGMAITSPQKGWLQVNDKLCEMLGYSREELTCLTWAEMTYPEDLAPDIAQFERLLSGEIDGYTLEKRFLRKDRSVVFTNLAVGCVRLPDRSVDYVLALLEDITESKRAEEAIRTLNTTLEAQVQERTVELKEAIATLNAENTERKRAEENLHKLNRELRAISDCNQALMRAEDEQTLLGEICRIVCDEAGYRMAWVGYAEHDDARTVRPVAWAGAENGYLSIANITWADTERGHGPAGNAIRSGESACIRDFTTDPQVAPWRESALQRGYRSSIALPLKDENALTFGAFCIYSTEPNAFTPDEIRLLDELAGDLAFGIMVLRNRIERKQAEEAKAESQQLLQDISDNSNSLIYACDLQGRFMLVNRKLESVFCVTREALIGNTREAIMPPEIAAAHRNNDLKVIDALKPLVVEEENNEPDGIHTYLSVKFPIIGPQGNVQGVGGISTDITEHKRSEEELNKYRDHLEELVKARTAEIEQKNAELERMNKIFVGRELRMVELKEKIRELESRLQT